MAGFLGSLFPFDQPAPQTQADSIARATGGSPSAAYGSFGLGPVGPWDIDFAVKNALERVTWVFRPVDVIAQNQSRIPIRLRRGRDSKNGEWIEDKRIWNLLNVRPNSYEQAWQFRYRLTAILLLSRRGAFIEIRRNAFGEPVELHLLPPGVTLPVPDPEKFIKGYRVTRSDWQIDDMTPEQVLWIRTKPHPTDPYAQLTPLMAAGITAETDFFAHLFNRNFLANDGRPGTVVSIEGQLNAIDAAEIKARFSGGPLRAGEVTVIEAAGVSINDMSTSPRDVQWDKLMEMTKEELLMAFGVPESVTGNASGRTFDNADAERENFWVDTMIPHCDALANSMDVLTQSTNDENVLAFDYSDIDVLQRAANRKKADAREEFEAGLRTIDSYMELIGEKPWNVPGTRALWHPLGVPIGPNPADQKILDDMKPITLPEAPQQLAIGQSPNGSAAMARSLRRHPGVGARGQKTLERALALAKPVRAITVGRESKDASDSKEGDLPGPVDDIIDVEIIEEVVHDPHAEHRAYIEGSIEGLVEAFDDRQADVVVDRLAHVKSRKGTRHWDGEVKAVPAAGSYLKPIDADYSVDTDRWVEDMVTTMEKVIIRAVRREMNQAAATMEREGVLDRYQRVEKGRALVRLYGGEQYVNQVRAEIVETAMDIVRNAVMRQSERIKKKINDSDRSGESMTGIQREVRGLIGSRGTWRKALSSNIATQVIEGSKAAVFGELHGIYRKTWVKYHLEDGRTRPTHADADGQQVGAKDRFHVGAAWLSYPGDPSGPPEETINCRCHVRWSIDVTLPLVP